MLSAGALAAAAAVDRGRSTAPAAAAAADRSEGYGHRSDSCGCVGPRSAASSKDASATSEDEAGGPSVGCCGHCSVAVEPAEWMGVWSDRLGGGDRRLLVSRLGVIFAVDLSEQTLHRKVP